jgi:hypothetical protein
MKRTIVLIVFFSLLAGTAFALPPRSVDEIPVFQGATRDRAAEGDFMQFASGVARVYRTSAPIEEVFAFYKKKLDAKSGGMAEMAGGSTPTSGSPGSVSYSVEKYEEDEENPTPELQSGDPIREVFFSWTTAVKDGSVAEFAVELLNAREEEDSGAQARRGTRIAMSQVGVMLQAQAPPSEDDDKKWLASLPPPKIPELDHWRDVMVIRGTWAFQGATGGAGPLAEGTGSAGGSGQVTLKRAPLDRFFPSQLKFTGPVDGTAFVSEKVSFIKGTTTESGGCGGSLIGQDKGFSYLSVTLDLDDGTYSVDLSGTVGGCSQVTMQVTGQDVSHEVDTAAFSVMAPYTAASIPQIPRDGLYLSLSSPAMVVAGHGLPLVGEGRVIVQLGRVPDGWYTKLKHKAEEEEKKRKEPPKEEPPKEDKDPKVIRIKSYRVNLNKEPDWFSDPIRVLMRNQEVELIEEQGFWQKVRDVNSGDEGWIHRTTTTEKKLDWSKAENLSGKAGPVTADEVMEGGRG